jgi:hypothetical protein
MERANATFEIKGWDEKPYDEFDGRKLTRASVKRAYRGDIDAESTTEYLMVYAVDGSASFVGVERVVGKLGRRAGSFVLQHTGTFTGGVASASWFVVAGSGTGALSKLKGNGNSSIGHADQYAMALDYEWDSAPVMRDDM